MKLQVFHIEVTAKPTDLAPHFDEVAGAHVIVWVKAKNPNDALNKALFHVGKQNWLVVSVSAGPVPLLQSDITGNAEAVQMYADAQLRGVASMFFAWSRDGSISRGPVSISPGDAIDMSEVLSELKRNKNRGRCLHYNAGERCNRIVRAHSVQKKGQLSRIAVDGHVYTPSANLSSTAAHSGNDVYGKTGIKKVSTFLGFCGYHDNKLFAPIDNDVLVPTQEQVFLYGYRSLCREYFVKENALRTAENTPLRKTAPPVVVEMLDALTVGFHNGLDNLTRHKQSFDESLRSQSFSDLSYVLFVSSDPQAIAFSSLISPDFDFQGRPLQNLSDLHRPLDLLTFCSAPVDSGWGFLLAWHESSRGVCRKFIDSLFAATEEGSDAEALLFRLMLHGENHAVSPEWWEGLTHDAREVISATFSDAVDPFADIPSDWLLNGVPDYSGWRFDELMIG